MLKPTCFNHPAERPWLPCLYGHHVLMMSELDACIEGALPHHGLSL